MCINFCVQQHITARCISGCNASLRSTPVMWMHQLCTVHRLSQYICVKVLQLCKCISCVQYLTQRTALKVQCSCYVNASIMYNASVWKCISYVNDFCGHCITWVHQLVYKMWDSVKCFIASLQKWMSLLYNASVCMHHCVQSITWYNASVKVHQIYKCIICVPCIRWVHQCLLSLCIRHKLVNELLQKQSTNCISLCTILELVEFSGSKDGEMMGNSSDGK